MCAGARDLLVTLTHRLHAQVVVKLDVGEFLPYQEIELLRFPKVCMVIVRGPFFR